MKTATIVRVVRQLRGGSHSALVETDSGRHYVAKFCHNPQGTRTLINEVLGSAVMQRVGICTPSLRVLTLPEEVGAHFYRDRRCKSPKEKWPFGDSLHLGSECPANPDRVAIWDLLPRKLLPRVANLGDFGRAFAIDRWLNQIDIRQAIFFKISGQARGEACYQTSLIDHGFAFQGTDWKFDDDQAMPLRGLYIDRFVYRLLDMQRLCEETLDRVMDIGDGDLHSTADSLPDCWFCDGERGQLKEIIKALCVRKAILPTILKRNLQNLHHAIARTGEPRQLPDQRDLLFA